MFRLAADVEVLSDPQGQLWLRQPNGRVFLTTAAAKAVVPLLRAGADRATLARSLDLPVRDVVAALDGFLASLQDAGVLERTAAGAAASVPAPIELEVRWVEARPRRTLALVLAEAGAITLGASTAALLLASRGTRELLQSAAVPAGLWALLALPLLWVPLHELGHLGAAHCSGVRGSRIGLRRSGPLWRIGVWGHPLANPTSGQRVAIALAGPGVDFLLCAGLVALSGALAPSALRSALDALLAFGIAAALLNLSPLRGTDGEQAARTYLDAVREHGCEGPGPWLRRGAVRLLQLSVFAAFVLYGVVAVSRTAEVLLESLSR